MSPSTIWAGRARFQSENPDEGAGRAGLALRRERQAAHNVTAGVVDQTGQNTLLAIVQGKRHRRRIAQASLLRTKARLGVQGADVRSAHAALQLFRMWGVNLIRISLCTTPCRITAGGGA